MDASHQERQAKEVLLKHAQICSYMQVQHQVKADAQRSLEYTGMLFQPVPWTPATKKGMPEEYERYHADPDYHIINIPPNFMFKAKIFKPSRLCAIYKSV